MNRPLVITTLFYILGVVLGRYLEFGFAIPFILAVIIMILGLYFKTKRKESFLFILFFLLGFTLCFNIINTKDDFLEEIVETEKEVTFIGYVTDVGLTKKGSSKINMSVKEVLLDNELFDKSFNLLVYFKEEEEIEYGELIHINGLLLKPEKLRNLGGFDEEKYLNTKKIFYKSFGEIHKKENEFDKVLTLKNKGVKLFSSVFESLLPEEEAGIIKAMVLGDTSTLSDETKDLYRTGGIYHVLVISGMHFTILSTILLLVLRKFLNPKPSYIIVALFLISYCFFTGLAQSSVRAVVMGTLVLLGDMIYRETDLFTSLAFASLVTLISYPLNLWDIGFQFSYGAVLGFALLYNPLIRFLTNLKRFRIGHVILSKDFIIKFIASFMAVNLIITPIAVFYFYTLYPYAIFANFIISFTTSLIIVLSFATVIMAFIFYPIGIFLSGGIYFILKFYKLVCIFFEKLPFSKILIGKPHIIIFVLYIILLIVSRKYFSVIKSKQKNYKNILISVLAFSIIFISIEKFLILPSTVSMLDVGQGDCFVIEYNTKTYIIDTGENYFSLGNYLDYKGITNIESVFISHTDSDHSGGLIELMDNKKIKHIFLPLKNYEDDEIYSNLVKIAEKNNLSMQFTKSGDIINFGKNLEVKCLSPYVNYVGDSNNSSMVFNLKFLNNNFLFTGDIEKQGEENLVSNNSNIKADVLKIPHHGSKTSTSQKLLDAVSPKIALISSGKNNQFGHPAPEIIDKLEDYNVKILRTDKQGMVIIKVENKRLSVKTILK